MGIFSKLFGKKNEDLDSDLLLNLKQAPSEEPFPKEPLGLEEKPVIPETPTQPTELPPHLEEPLLGTPTAPSTPTTPAPTSQRDLELINSKLDTLKAILNSMDQRIANLEQAAGIEKKKMPW